MIWSLFNINLNGIVRRKQNPRIAWNWRASSPHRDARGWKSDQANSRRGQTETKRTNIKGACYSKAKIRRVGKRKRKK
jgi:hypothetical protein